MECATPEPVGEQALLETTHCEACYLDLPIAGGVYHLGGGRTLKLTDRDMKLPPVMGQEIVAKAGKLNPLPIQARPHGSSNEVRDELRSKNVLGRQVLAF